MDRCGVSKSRSTYKNLLEKPTGRRLLERPRRRCRNILRCSFNKQNGGGGPWAQKRDNWLAFVNTVRD